MEKTTNLKQLIIKYKKSDSFLRPILCRGEFNKFRVVGNHWEFDNGFYFHEALRKIIELKTKRYSRLTS